MEYAIPDNVMRQAERYSDVMDYRGERQVISNISRSLPQRHHDNTLPDPIDYLKEIMDKRGLCNKDMKAYIGSSGNISSVLNRRKPLSLRMIRNLHKYLGIPADVLIQPYDCR